MPDLDLRLEDFRARRFGPLDRLIYRQTPELVDLHPRSEAADRVLRDLERFSSHTCLSAMLTSYLLSRLPADATRPARALELCAGSGWLSRGLLQRAAQAGRTLTMVASDLHQPTRPADGVVWHVADATRLPIRDQSFDLVFCVNSVHHFTPARVGRLLAEAARVARIVCVYDLRRTLFGAALTRMAASLYSREFALDSVRSHRRAYSLEEMRFLVDEMGLSLKVSKCPLAGMLIETEARTR